MKNDRNGANRRQVLKRLAAGATLLGASGLGSAREQPDVERSPEMKEAAAKFDSDPAIQRALESHAEPVRGTLAEAGVSVPLDIGAFDDVRSFPDRDDGTPTAHIVAGREAETGRVEIHVLPQADRTFAIRRGESTTRYFDADGTMEALGCDTTTYCGGCCAMAVPTPRCEPNCKKGYEVTQECCTFPDGTYTCETLSSICTSSCGYCG
jgi:hypothetical protein